MVYCCYFNLWSVLLASSFLTFFLKNGPFPASFLYFRLFNTVVIIIIFFRWLDSNRGPLESKATALPTEPQPLPIIFNFIPEKKRILVNFVRAAFGYTHSRRFFKYAAFQSAKNNYNYFFLLITKKIFWWSNISVGLGLALLQFHISQVSHFLRRQIKPFLRI